MVKQLYGVRSKAVHGAKLSSVEIREHTIKVREILAQVICKFIEDGCVYSEEEIESLLFENTLHPKV
jgi:hypothetical protein